MKTIVVNQKNRVQEWVADRIGGNPAWESFEAIGLEKDGELIAGVIVDGYVENTRCSIHCAGEGKQWLNREFLFVVFDYVFRQLNCNVVVQTVCSNNVDSMKFTSHLGFGEKCRIEDGALGGDLVILSMRREDCRWIKPRMKNEPKE